MVTQFRPSGTQICNSPQKNIKEPRSDLTLLAGGNVFPLSTPYLESEPRKQTGLQRCSCWNHTFDVRAGINLWEVRTTKLFAFVLYLQTEQWPNRDETHQSDSSVDYIHSLRISQHTCTYCRASWALVWSGLTISHGVRERAAPSRWRPRRCREIQQSWQPHTPWWSAHPCTLPSRPAAWLMKYEAMRAAVLCSALCHMSLPPGGRRLNMQKHFHTRALKS